MILLDTNVVSDALRSTPDPRVTTWLDAQVIDTLWLSVISVAEVRFGIAALPEGRRKTEMRTRLADTILPAFSGRILDITESTTMHFADLLADTRARGRALGPFDALIAATALEHRLAVATRDTTPFLAAGLEVIDPFTDGTARRPAER